MFDNISPQVLAALGLAQQQDGQGASNAAPTPTPTPAADEPSPQAPQKPTAPTAPAVDFGGMARVMSQLDDQVPENRDVLNDSISGAKRLKSARAEYVYHEHNFKTVRDPDTGAIKEVPKGKLRKAFEDFSQILSVATGNPGLKEDRMAEFDKLFGEAQKIQTQQNAADKIKATQAIAAQKNAVTVMMGGLKMTEAQYKTDADKFKTAAQMYATELKNNVDKLKAQIQSKLADSKISLQERQAYLTQMKALNEYENGGLTNQSGLTMRLFKMWSEAGQATGDAKAATGEVNKFLDLLGNVNKAMAQGKVVNLGTTSTSASVIDPVTKNVVTTRQNQRNLSQPGLPGLNPNEAPPVAQPGPGLQGLPPQGMPAPAPGGMTPTPPVGPAPINAQPGPQANPGPPSPALAANPVSIPGEDPSTLVPPKESLGAVPGQEPPSAAQPTPTTIIPTPPQPKQKAPTGVAPSTVTKSPIPQNIKNLISWGNSKQTESALDTSSNLAQHTTFALTGLMQGMLDGKLNQGPIWGTNLGKQILSNLGSVHLNDIKTGIGQLQALFDLAKIDLKGVRMTQAEIFAHVVNMPKTSDNAMNAMMKLMYLNQLAKASSYMALHHLNSATVNNQFSEDLSQEIDNQILDFMNNKWGIQIKDHRSNKQIQAIAPGTWKPPAKLPKLPDPDEYIPQMMAKQNYMRNTGLEQPQEKSTPQSNVERLKLLEKKVLEKR